MAGRGYPADTQRQRSFAETIKKERDARLAWWKKLVQGGENAASMGGKSQQYHVFRKKIENQNAAATAEELTKKLPEIRKEKHFHKRMHSDLDALMLNKDSGKNVENILVEMRPPRRRTRKLLYNGFSKEGAGRFQYLQKRYHEIPEDKFAYPILSSWEYGWRLGDVIKKEDIKKPEYGRTRIVADTFYTRTGIPTLERVQTSLF
ncbi:uncharacterized protein LOC141902348 [Tubulanus polymorphus]|uniref:uncharacterized protein LOC141902348 n=1 Tax=Tubulanus polymorphus TaxID=672921 RepID=UPI003DA5A785